MDSALYTLLKSIQPEGLTENAWASRAKVNRSWFNDVRKGTTPRTDTLERVVGVAGYSMAQFYDLDRQNSGSNRMADKRVPFAHLTPVLPFTAAQEAIDIPLVGTAQGSDLEVSEDGGITFIERMSLDESNVVEYLRRPQALIGRDDVYAITIIGNSMATRYEDGDPAYVSSKQRPRNGDYVVVQLKRRGDGGEDQLHIALLKRMVRRSSTYIELAQNNPEVTFTVPVEEIHAVHRVIPWREIVHF